MASTLNSPLTISLPNSIIQTPFFPKPSQRPMSLKKKPKNVVSCHGKQNNGFDRRDILLGLGGLYGSANLVTDPFALAAPIRPDILNCDESTVDDNKTNCVNVPCCPPKPTREIIDFKLPEPRNIRYRPAAHLVDRNYLYKFELAMERMRALPPEDPHSFKSQADIHCAYCNGGYSQMGDPDQKLSIHYSWLFFPFHRMYLYFFERILGKLIDDPDFAIPFWNWDSPDGMTMPQIYVDPSSPLYDVNRNPDHQPPTLINLKDGKSFDPTISIRDQIKKNMCVMYKEMVRNSKTASCFHGAVYRAGCKSYDDPTCTAEPRGGTIENGVHLNVHKFVGNPSNTFKEDMGNFYSAGKDPLFYAHHANVDRMWSIWKDIPGKKKPGKTGPDFNDDDWLDSSFLFYDEDKNLVRPKVSQFIDTQKLGYDYQMVDLPWLKSRPTPRRRRAKVQGQSSPSSDGNGETNVIDLDLDGGLFPLVLDKLVRIRVSRPKKQNTGFGEDKEEVLILKNIELNSNDSVQFEVCIGGKDDKTPCDDANDSEHIGDYNHIPHGTCEAMKIKTSKYFSISDLLEELNMKGEDSIVVTLNPKEGEGLVSIGGIAIDYVC